MLISVNFVAKIYCFFYITKFFSFFLVFFVSKEADFPILCSQLCNYFFIFQALLQVMLQIRKTMLHCITTVCNKVCNFVPVK